MVVSDVWEKQKYAEKVNLSIMVLTDEIGKDIENQLIDQQLPVEFRR